MTSLLLARAAAGDPSGAYRGPDRRGLITELARTGGAATAVGLGAGAVGAPVAAAAALAALGADAPSWLTGLADVTFAFYAAAAILLGLFWRLVGDAAAALLGGVALVAGLAIVPAMTRPVAAAGPVACGLAVAFVVLGAAAHGAAFGPQVRGGLRPGRALGLVVAAGVTVALALWATPAGRLVEARAAGIRISWLVEGVGLLLVGLAALWRATRAGRVLSIAGATATISIGAAGAIQAVGAGDGGRELSVLLLAAGAVELLAATLGDLRPAVGAVVRQDVRGRRRWEAAERQLLADRTSIRGQRHDLRNMLAGIDGTLLVLGSQRDRLPANEIDRMVQALRDEVRWLQALVGDAVEASRYDLSELVSSLVAVRAVSDVAVRCLLAPRLLVDGRPDRVAMTIDNLLSNAAVHAPGAGVVVRTRLVPAPAGHLAELAVSDEGPGLSEADERRACERNWRAAAAAGRPGSGLGLAQCCELVEAEGGSLVLGPTHGERPVGARGLTVTVRLPLSPGSAAPPPFAFSEVPRAVR